MESFLGIGIGHLCLGIRYQLCRSAGAGYRRVGNRKECYNWGAVQFAWYRIWAAHDIDR